MERKRHNTAQLATLVTLLDSVNKHNIPSQDSLALEHGKCMFGKVVTGIPFYFAVQKFVVHYQRWFCMLVVINGLTTLLLLLLH